LIIDKNIQNRQSKRAASTKNLYIKRFRLFHLRIQYVDLAAASPQCAAWLRSA